MIKYSLKRLVYMIPVTIAVVFLVYLIMYLTPGDPVAVMLGGDATPQLIEETRESLGITKPFLEQFFNYIVKLFQGDFGTSWYTGEAVSIRLFAAIPYTLKLTFAAMFLSIVISIPLGVIAAVNQNTAADYCVSAFSICGVSAPTFWIGIMLILLFSLELDLLPAAGANKWQCYILPAVTMSFNQLASVTRTQRSSMLEVLRQDYIRTAKAKGVSNRKATYVHALRNAIIPSITVAGLNFGSLMAGSVAIETVFAIPGIGRLMIDSIKIQDTPSVVACMVFVSITVSVINLMVDLLYALIDPRIKAQYLRGGNNA